MTDILVLVLATTVSLFVVAGLLVFFQSPAAKRFPYITAMIAVLSVGCFVIAGIHIQIPDQSYCDDILQNNHGLGRIFYQESLTRYDFSLNESKCTYSDDGEFIANPKYSIWGLRI